jgi:transcriptional regulator with XRE-family HTH domain
MRITDQMTDEMVLDLIGQRLESTRITHNLTQANLADRAGVSKSTVERLEKGNTTQLSSFIRVCRALELLTRFEALLPEPVPSPMAQLKLRREHRQRASPLPKNETTEGWTWKDEE